MQKDVSAGLMPELDAIAVDHPDWKELWVDDPTAS